jgi:hypothetical protein
LKFCRLRFLFHELLVLRRWLLMNSFWPEDPRLLPVFFWFFFFIYRCKADPRIYGLGFCIVGRHYFKLNKVFQITI